MSKANYAAFKKSFLLLLSCLSCVKGFFKNPWTFNAIIVYLCTIGQNYKDTKKGKES